MHGANIMFKVFTVKYILAFQTWEKAQGPQRRERRRPQHWKITTDCLLHALQGWSCFYTISVSPPAPFYSLNCLSFPHILSREFLLPHWWWFFFFFFSGASLTPVPLPLTFFISLYSCTGCSKLTHWCNSTASATLRHIYSLTPPPTATRTLPIMPPFLLLQPAFTLYSSLPILSLCSHSLAN